MDNLKRDKLIAHTWRVIETFFDDTFSTRFSHHQSKKQNELNDGRFICQHDRHREQKKMEIHESRLRKSD